MSKTALTGISHEAGAEAFDSSWWFEPFGLDPETIAANFLATAISRAVVAKGCAANRATVPFGLPPGEPEGFLLTFPTARFGLAALISKDCQGQASLSAAWPFTMDGVEHEVRIRRLYIGPDRLQAMVQGSIDDTLSLIWHDVMFPVDRAFYAEGSVHRVALAGFAHRFSVGARPKIRLTPDAKSYSALREMHPASVDPDGAITLHTEGLAAIIPLENPSLSDASPMMFSIQGPVVHIEKYAGSFFDREVWDIRVTVARIGPEHDKNFDLSILVSDIALAGQALPKVGDDVSALIRLQGRISKPNVQTRNLLSRLWNFVSDRFSASAGTAKQDSSKRAITRRSAEPGKGVPSKPEVDSPGEDVSTIDRLKKLAAQIEDEFGAKTTMAVVRGKSSPKSTPSKTTESEDDGGESWGLNRDEVESMNEMRGPYFIFVDDNFHYMQREHRTGPTEYASLDVALVDAKRMVEEFLMDNHKPGMSADELWELYRSFGDDPFIVARDGLPRVEFSAWTYAKERAREICKPKDK